METARDTQKANVLRVLAEKAEERDQLEELAKMGGQYWNGF